MMKISLAFSFIVFTVAVFQFCTGNREEKITGREIQQTEEALIGVNRRLVQKDKEKIVSYMRLKNLVLTETASGLWYGIMKEGKGQKVLDGAQVTLKYKVSLLDGTLCYDSDSLGMKQFKAGKGGVESGLEEGILLLREGSQAVMIMPPHLAHGLTGDGNRIPARSIIVYNVELIKVDAE